MWVDTSAVPSPWDREISLPDVAMWVDTSEGWASRQLPQTEECSVPGSMDVVPRGKQREVP